MSGPSERMLELLSLLQDGRAWQGGDLAARLGTSPRTLRRDIDRLRHLGYPVISARGPGGSYQLVAGRAMPPLLFTDDEAVAAVVGLRLGRWRSPQAARQGRGRRSRWGGRRSRWGGRRSRWGGRCGRRGRRGRVAQARAGAAVSVALPARGDVGLHRRRVAHHVEPGPAVPAAARRGRVLPPGCAVRVHRPRRPANRAAGRAVPAGVARQALVPAGWDLDRDDWRTFRLDRISDLAVPGSTFIPREPPPDASFVQNPLRSVRSTRQGVAMFSASINTCSID